MKKIVIFTGPSGSGLTSARYVFEELKYHIIENIPVNLTFNLLDSLYIQSYRSGKFCIIVPIYSAKRIFEIAKADTRFETKLVLLSSEKEEILKRYTLTRHVHPLATLMEISLENAIDNDLKLVSELYVDADIVLDSSSLSVKELRHILYERLQGSKKGNTTSFTFLSFGLKNGTPNAIDMMLDVRVIPNPYWVEELKPLTGYDQPVIDYMMSFESTKKLLNGFVSFLTYHLEQIVLSDRPCYTIGIACSGGQHRSTFVAKYLCDYFSSLYDTNVIHRDSPQLNQYDY